MRTLRWKLAPQQRRGAIAPLVALLMIPLIGMVAMAVDYGYLLDVRTDLQRAADATALAAVRDLIPDANGYQNQAQVRNRARQYAAANVTDISGFTVPDADIQIGRYNPATIDSAAQLLNTGVYDTVRVTLRRDTTANSPVSLFFARVMGFDTADVTATATAVLQKASFIEASGDILPFAVPEGTWDDIPLGDGFVVYDNEMMTDLSGNAIPGNWGTLDIGYTNNSVADMNDQILTGLRQADLDQLYADGRIGTDQYLDTTVPSWFQADTGLSQGLKQSVQEVYGTIKLIPIFDDVSGNAGGGLEYRIVKWGVVEVITSNWGNNPSVTVGKRAIYDGKMIAQDNLSNTDGVIEGAYTTPALVH